MNDIYTYTFIYNLPLGCDIVSWMIYVHLGARFGTKGLCKQTCIISISSSRHYDNWRIRTHLCMLFIQVNCWALHPLCVVGHACKLSVKNGNNHFKEILKTITSLYIVHHKVYLKILVAHANHCSWISIFYDRFK